MSFYKQVVSRNSVLRGRGMKKKWKGRIEKKKKRKRKIIKKEAGQQILKKLHYL